MSLGVGFAVRAAVWSAVAVALGSAPTGARRLRPVNRASRSAEGVARARAAWPAALGLGVLVWLCVGSLGLALSVSLAAVTGAAVVLRRRRAARAWRSRQDVADASRCLASEIAAGQPASVALQVAAVDYPVLGEGAAQVRLGGDPCDGWMNSAQVPGCEGLAHLAAAWRVCVSTGAPLGPSLQAVATALHQDRELARTVGQELAAARATGRLMAFLPGLGVLLGYAMGGDPVRFLVGSAWGQVCLTVGAGLACAGLLWSEQLVDGAAG